MPIMHRHVMYRHWVSGEHVAMSGTVEAHRLAVQKHISEQTETRVGFMRVPNITYWRFMQAPIQNIYIPNITFSNNSMKGCGT